MKIEVREIEHVLEVDIDRLKVNPVYEGLVSKHSPEALKALKKDIKNHGQLVPIVVNKDFEIVDGYTRRKILKELGYKEAKVIVREFKDKIEELWYVCNSNVVRRQLNTWQKITSLLRTIELVLKSQGIKTPLKDYLQKRGRKGNSEVTSEFRTKSIADQLGLSERTVEQALYIYFNGTQELHKRLERGQISIFQAYNRLKKQTQVQKPRAKKDLRDRIIVCPYCHKMFSIGDVNGS
jgi:ParB-like chromosome segregation protein Spo0J